MVLSGYRLAVFTRKLLLFIPTVIINGRVWQVIELEQSRGSLLVEKQQLTEIISSLELKINNLESTAGFPHSSTDDKVVRNPVSLGFATCDCWKNISPPFRIAIIILYSWHDSIKFSFQTQTSPDGELNYQLEAARTLVAKLVADNSELVEKVSCKIVKSRISAMISNWA